MFSLGKLIGGLTILRPSTPDHQRLDSRLRHLRRSLRFQGFVSLAFAIGPIAALSPDLPRRLLQHQQPFVPRWLRFVALGATSPSNPMRRPITDQPSHVSIASGSKCFSRWNPQNDAHLPCACRGFPWYCAPSDRFVSAI
jgi:hypothetical protein